MKGKTYIIARRGFTCINFSLSPEMAMYFQRKYASPKTNTTTTTTTTTNNNNNNKQQQQQQQLNKKSLI